jgi:hypothetical protein
MIEDLDGTLGNDQEIDEAEARNDKDGGVGKDNDETSLA